jgi:hypothetical protein
MRKNITFTIATAALALTMMVWAKAAVVATHAEAVRPAVSLPPSVMTNSYLPIRALDEVY